MRWGGVAACTVSWGWDALDIESRGKAHCMVEMRVSCGIHCVLE